MAIREETFSFFSDFISQFSKILFPPNGIFRRDEFLFRGQGSSKYKLMSKFDRTFSALDPTDKVSRYEALISNLMDEYRKIGKEKYSENEYTGLAQHYGIPTRMLDWTSSPLVACYFAFNEKVMTRSNDRFVSIWALNRKDTDIWSARSGIEIVELQFNGNDRASRQLGYSTKLSSPHDCIEDVITALRPRRDVLWKFNIDANDAEFAFSFLDASNVRATELFGDVEGAARSALERVYLEFGP